MVIRTNYQDIFSIGEDHLNKIDDDIFNFLKFWLSNKRSITVKTSGSTGKPKLIEISRETFMSSAKSTLEFFNLKQNSKFHCCLPVKYIGGKMMLIRAIINKGDIVLSKPTTNAVKNLNEIIDFSAMTALQATKSIHEKEFKNIKRLIIGGGSISDSLINQLNETSTHCYQTFGMTETASHIAIRDLRKVKDDNRYECLDHVKISTNKNNQLVIKSKSLNINSVTTNDVIEISDNKYFKFIGRLDNIINSGGIKINPETIENQLSKTIKNDHFFIDKISDDMLGEKLILISLKAIDIKLIKKAVLNIKDHKLRPKLVLQNKEFYYTDNYKINRKKTLVESLKYGTSILIK
jgi:O-succinylbenzoic acid--CoA ligase